MRRVIWRRHGISGEEEEEEEEAGEWDSAMPGDGDGWAEGGGERDPRCKVEKRIQDNRMCM